MFNKLAAFSTFSYSPGSIFYLYYSHKYNFSGGKWLFSKRFLHLLERCQLCPQQKFFTARFFSAYLKPILILLKSTRGIK